jgi:hypothetical protein
MRAASQIAGLEVHFVNTDKMAFVTPFAGMDLRGENQFAQ